MTACAECGRPEPAEWCWEARINCPFGKPNLGVPELRDLFAALEKRGTVSGQPACCKGGDQWGHDWNCPTPSIPFRESRAAIGKGGDSMILGFTGTRGMPTPEQQAFIDRNVSGCDELHHGACVGSDAVAHVFGLLYARQIRVHPPEDTKLVDLKAVMPRNRDLVKVLPAKPYHARNRDIVDACEVLIATPDGRRRPRSGTWYTIDYARANKVPVVVCLPDGTIDTDSTL